MLVGLARDTKERIRGTIFVTHENFAVQHLVVAEDVVEHLLVEILGRCGEGDLHAAGFLLLEVDVGWVLVQADANGF